jgi:hypothetical protein
VVDCYVFVTPPLDFDGTHDPIKSRRRLERARAAQRWR